MPNLPDSRRRSAGATRSVFLVGFMGSGKSSVGKALADVLGWPFLDLDDLIEQREGRTIAEIFGTDGELEFRRVERNALRQVLVQCLDPQIVALGGGAFAQAENVELIQQAGVMTVFLDAPPETLWQRCNEDFQDRPLRRTFEHFAELHRLRRPHYLQATCRVDTTNKSAGQIVEELASKLRAGSLPDQENIR